MHDWYGALGRRYRALRSDNKFWVSLPLAAVLFALAVLLNTYAGIYATEKASNSVTDIILSNIPVFDVDQIFVYGALAFMAFAAILLILYPRKIPFTLYCLALFYITRAVFVSLTHIGPYPDHTVLDFHSKIILTLFGGDDEFFSGHTGAPFMLALVFWDTPRLRYFFIASSIFFGIIVLLGHLHYTIDVLSAFFITYGVYKIAVWLFPEEQRAFMKEHS